MVDQIYSATVSTPIGPLCVMSNGEAIVKLSWQSGGDADGRPELDEAVAQLEAYFEGRLQNFDLPLLVNGSDFQRQVCDAMSAIPFGETLTYGDIAKQTASPAQAVGTACGANPIPVIIPCHRVLAANGLGGYSGSGGIETKVWLLRHEGAAGLLI
ncbi:MAG: methylated-DNA--[protein]-cysteine S-methyltransferase [Pseudomonadota bacterium]